MLLKSYGVCRSSSPNLENKGSILKEQKKAHLRVKDFCFIVRRLVSEGQVLLF